MVHCQSLEKQRGRGCSDEELQPHGKVGSHGGCNELGPGEDPQDGTEAEGGPAFTFLLSFSLSESFYELGLPGPQGLVSRALVSPHLLTKQ